MEDREWREALFRVFLHFEPLVIVSDFEPRISASLAVQH